MDNLDDISKLFESVKEQKTYRKGAYIYREGDATAGIYRVMSGRVKLWKRNEKANRNIIFYLVHSHEFFGVLENFINIDSRRCAAIAIEKNVIVQHVPFSEFEKCILSNPAYNFAIIQDLVKKCEINWEKYHELQMGDITQRVFKTIKKMAIERGSNTKRGVIIKGINHQELADYIGSSRTTVAGVMNRFRKEKIIE